MAQAGVFSHELPVGSQGHRASGWWGMLALIATEAALFAYLLFSYYYLASQAHGPWPPEGLPRLRIAAPNTLILLVSSVAVWWGERGVRRGERRALLIGLATAVALGIVFMALQGVEWHNKPFTLTSGAYGSLYFTITGFHMAHVLVGLLILATLLLWTGLGYIGGERYAPVTIGAVYWHFVDVVWLAVFFTFYVVPYLG